MYQLQKLQSIEVVGKGGGVGWGWGGVIFGRTARAELQILVDEMCHKERF